MFNTNILKKQDQYEKKMVGTLDNSNQMEDVNYKNSMPVRFPDWLMQLEREEYYRSYFNRELRTN